MEPVSNSLIDIYNGLKRLEKKLGNYRLKIQELTNKFEKIYYLENKTERVDNLYSIVLLDLNTAVQNIYLAVHYLNKYVFPVLNLKVWYGRPD